MESAASTVDVVTQRHDELDERCQTLEREVALKDKTIAALHEREQNADEQIRAVEHLHHRSQKSNAELEARLKVLEGTCTGLSDQLNERMEEIKTLGGVKKSQRHLQNEVDRMKVDNARLVKMLSSTREYAEFVQRAYAQSDVAYVAHGSPLVDLRIITEDYVVSAAQNRAGGTSDRPLGDAKSEFAHWIPADILHYARECRTRYLPAVSDDSFGNFLHAMHLRWRAHENRVLNKRELQHDREKQDMFRQIAQRKPHDVTKLEHKVKHLSAQLRSATGVGSGKDSGLGKGFDWNLAPPGIGNSQ
eukprot:COSAG05_NODE_3647_length_1935_cov_0.949346_1_plen_304_part_00